MFFHFFQIKTKQNKQYGCFFVHSMPYTDWLSGITSTSWLLFHFTQHFNPFTRQCLIYNRLQTKDKTKTTVSFKKIRWDPYGERRADGLSSARDSFSWLHHKRYIYRIHWATETLQPYKASGVNEISPVLLQKRKKKLLPQLVPIFRSSLAIGYIPISWRRAKVIFILKLTKENFSNP